jgi:AraC-like DNA-binding protein
VLEALGVREGRAVIDARIARVLRALEAGELSRDEVTLAALAANAGISPTRLTHLFTHDVGTPLRRYVLWLRVRRALAALTTGAPPAEVAHAAGFADAAHLSRTVRQTFGMTPTQIQRSYAVGAPTDRAR